MKTWIMLAAAGFAGASLAAEAEAACDITVRFHNDGAETLTLLPEWARTRTRLGTWRRMWRDADPVEIEPGERYERVFRARQCAWTVMRRFEFHIEREPCLPERTETVTHYTLGGRPPRQRDRNEPPAATVVTFGQPNDGFLRTDSLNPDDPDNAGREGFEGDGLQLLVRDLGRVCEAARNPG